MHVVMVTGIGGVVGQGILRNLRSLSLPLRIVGTNVERVSAGNHLCDAVHVLPYAWEPAYVAAVAALVGNENVGLILPGTDHEADQLARHQAMLGSKVAAAPAAVTAMCLDKWATWQAFSAAGLPFAASVLPADYRGQFGRVVVKPRAGRGSRGIHVDPPDPAAFDSSYVVQEYLDGPELTTGFYVRQDGALHGAITLERELQTGNTARCQVIRQYDTQMHALLERLVAIFPFRGSANLQSRVTSSGIVPFEINCRISGTNSIRAQLGFPDVAFTIDEWLLGVRPRPPAVIDGCALRVMLDVVYPGRSLSQIDNRHDHFHLF